jgi:methionine salvage enolase-phosphatase E1
VSINFKKIKDDLEGIQLDYDVQGYLSTNQADEVMNHCKTIIDKAERHEKALKEIIGIVKLDAFAFHEVCAKVYEKAIEALGEDEKVNRLKATDEPPSPPGLLGRKKVDRKSWA